MVSKGHLSTQVQKGCSLSKFYNFKNSELSGSRTVKWKTSDGELILSDGCIIVPRGVHKRRMDIPRRSQLAISNGESSRGSGSTSQDVHCTEIRLKGKGNRWTVAQYQEYSTAVQIQFSKFQHFEFEKKQAFDRHKRVRKSMIMKQKLAVVKKLCSA